MLKTARQLSLWALLAIALAFFVWTFATSSSFQACIQQKNETRAAKSEKNPPEFLFTAVEQFSGFFRCGLGVTYGYRDAVTAIATAFIAVFTFTLWQSTRKLWIAGERQIEIAMTAAEAAMRQAGTAESAFTKLERPYVFIFGVSKLEISRDRPLNQQPHVKYVVANYGKTPATIESIRAGIVAHDEPIAPLPVDYIDDPSHSLLAAPILYAGELRNGLTVEAPAGIVFEPADESFAGVWEPVPQLTGQDQLFVWISVKYRGPWCCRESGWNLKVA